MSDLVLVLWTWYVVVRVAQWLWSRRKIARRERLAAEWPVGSGKVSSGWVLPYSTRLNVTYKMTLPAYHVDSWKHDFRSKGEAEHAKKVLTGWECPVRYNPACEEQTTLMWADVQARLASEPYVAEVKPLTRAGYRWMFAWAVVGWCGLVACLAVYGMAMAGTSRCLCYAEIALVVPLVFILFGVIGTWGRLAMDRPGGAARQGLWRAMDVWERWVLGMAALGTVVSVAHFAPMMRAIPKDGNVPDKLVAGVLVAVVTLLYLAGALGATKVLRQPRHVDEAVGSAALA